jgi:Mrp family chromosome partitioning ATPase
VLSVRRRSEVLSRLTERYDLVVLDTAPLGVVAEPSRCCAR